MRLRHPIVEGIIANWDDIEAVWHYIFADHDQLCVSSREHPVFMTESVAGMPQDREKMAQVMFEKSAVPALAICTTAELAPFASGRNTGVVVEFGHDVTHVVPIYGGTIVREAVQRLDVGGAKLTEYLLTLPMEERSYCLISSQQRTRVEEVKDRLAYVALDFDEEMRKSAAAGPNGEHEFEVLTLNGAEAHRVGTEL